MDYTYTTMDTSENEILVDVTENGMDEETEMQYREMMRKQEKQNELESELRCLHSDLQQNTSECGDWRMAKAMEKLLIALQDCEVEKVGACIKNWATETHMNIGSQINDRMYKRDRVNEIEEELWKLSYGSIDEGGDALEKGEN